MEPVAQVRTERLALRPFRDCDRGPFAELNADPLVMEHFARPLRRAESDALVDRICRQWAERGFGLWAVERLDTAEFIGFAGLSAVELGTAPAPAVEVGWRLATAHWGFGFATEAGRESLRYGFVDIGLPEIVSFTSALNVRSWRVMERIGMLRAPDLDFEHPALPAGDPLRSHIVYRVGHGEWDPQVSVRRQLTA